jgi:tRNA1(Val) A37 N6-methylase TrmN6/superfamily II DNA or RNA helicase
MVHFAMNLGAIEQQGYYPTPEAVALALGRYMRFQDFISINIFDPCCGKGKALAILAQAMAEQAKVDYIANHGLSPADAHQQVPLNVIFPRTYGIELNEGRAKLAEQYVHTVIRAGFFQAKVPQRSMQVVLLNPPYMTDTEQVSRGHHENRMELTFLTKTTEYLAVHGILIYIVPQRILSLAAPFLARHYEHFSFWRFPSVAWDAGEDESRGPLNFDQIATGAAKAAIKHPKPIADMFDQYSQVVLMCRRKMFPDMPSADLVQALAAWGTMPPDELPQLDIHRRGRMPQEKAYEVPRALESPRYFLAKAFDPDKAARALSLRYNPEKHCYSLPTTGLMSLVEWREKRWPSDNSLTQSQHVTPLLPLKRVHRVLLAIAGLVDGAVLEGEHTHRRLLIQGHTRKLQRTYHRESDEFSTTITSDDYLFALVGLDLENGVYVQVHIDKHASPFRVPIGCQTEMMSIGEFLAEFGESLTATIAKLNPPRFVSSDQVPFAEKALRDLKRKPLGKQREFVLAFVNGLYHGIHRLGEIADTGTGKTYISPAILYSGDPWVNGHLAHFLTPDERVEYPKEAPQYIKRRRRRKPQQATALRYNAVSADQPPLHLFPSIAIVPAHLIRKWKREAELTIPGVKAVICHALTTKEDHMEFRQFDPQWTKRGGSADQVSATGCLDRIVAVIEADLAQWRSARNRAWRHGKPVPKKPAHIVIISAETAKLSLRVSPAYHMRPLIIRRKNPSYPNKFTISAMRDNHGQIVRMPHCVMCGKPILQMKKQDNGSSASSGTTTSSKTAHTTKAAVALHDDEEFDDEDALPLDLAEYASEQDLLAIDRPDDAKKWFCAYCGEPLWQVTDAAQGGIASFHALGKQHLPLEQLPVLRSTAKRPFALATYIAKHYPHIFRTFIGDEVHEGHDGTALSLAREQTISSCPYSLALTGTLSEGRASSFYALIRMMDPAVMHEFGYGGTRHWVQKYGYLVKEQKFKKDPPNTQAAYKATGVMSKQRKAKVVEKENPGFAPQGLRHLLTVCGFLELSDVTRDLPPYRERIHVIPMGKELQAAYDKLEADITKPLRQLLAMENKSLLAAWWHTLVNYTTMPWREWIVENKRTGVVLGSAPKLSEQTIWPKEQRLLELVEQNIKAGRRCLIYVEHTRKLNLIPRLQMLLTRHAKGLPHPIKVAALYSDTVKTLNREQRLTDQIAHGIDVLICQPKLVKTGLDLIDFPTIIFYEVPSSTFVLRQAAKRAYRPGQTQECQMHILVYPDMSMRLLQLMARKTESSMAVEGKMSMDGLSTWHGASSKTQEGNDDEDEDSSPTLDGNDLIMQLARTVLRRLEAKEKGDIAGSLSDELLAQAQDLQQEFIEAARTEDDLQRDIDGHDAAAENARIIREEALDVEPIVVEMLPVREPDPVQDDTPRMVIAPVTLPVTVIPTNRFADLWNKPLDEVRKLNGKTKKGGSRFPQRSTTSLQAGKSAGASASAGAGNGKETAQKPISLFTLI